MSSAAPISGTFHDVLVVGGGLVGASLAIALNRIGKHVGLIEAAPLGELPKVFDERNLSFSETTVNALRALGVMQKLRQPTGAIRRIHITRQGDFGRVLMNADDYDRTQFGEVVVARDFGEALESQLSESPHVTRYRPARFVGSRLQEDGLREVRIADDQGERSLQTGLLVAADGTRSDVRAALGITTKDYDYQQTLFVSRLRAERPPCGIAYERFGNEGPTALLPRGDQHFGLVHAVAKSDFDRVAAQDASAFLNRVQRAFGWRVGQLQSIGPLSHYAAISVVATQTIAPRAVLVGNAAQTLHPIGAQGFNLGLRDALTLAELIEAGGDITSTCGNEALLFAYERRRADDRYRTLSFSDGLAKVSSNSSEMLQPLRSLGLLAMDRLPWAQAPLVGSAMGYRGEVPALCRGGPQ